MLSALSVVAARALVAAELFVDQQHAGAGDKNQGTEAKPLRTIQAAVDKAQAGDTIWVKAGQYQEPVEVRSCGRIDAPITLSAWKDDHVRLGSALRELPPAGQWRPLANSKSWAVTLADEAPREITVILDDKPIVTQLKDAPPDDNKLDWATYRAGTRTLMVNVGAYNPAVKHSLRLASGITAITQREHFGFWHFKKLEIAWVYGGLVLCGHGNLVEDCFFHNTFRESIFLHGRLSTVRRCSFYRCGYGMAASGSGPGNIIEDCLFVQSGQDWEEDIRHRAMNYPDGLGNVTWKGDAYGQIFRYNVVADSHAGLWYDGGETGCRVIGNAFWDNRYGNGIYNEYCANDTLLLGNYFLHTSIVSSWCTRFNVIDNFVDGGQVVWHNHDVWPLRESYMLMRGNALIDVPNGYLHHYGRGWGKSYYANSFTNCMVDFNRFRVRPEQPWLVDAGKKFYRIEDIRKTYGWEIHGEGKTYDPQKNDLTPESLGASTVTFRVPWGPKSYLARPMLSDAGINGRWPAAPETTHTWGAPSFFWRLADGNFNPRTLRGYEPWFPQESQWQATSTAGYGQGENRGCRWYVDADPVNDVIGKLEGDQGVPELSTGNRWLVMMGLTPERIPPQGVGYWSPCLSTVAGAKTTVSLKLRGRNIISSEKGSPAIWLAFTSATGQDQRRAFLLGKDDQRQVHRPELTQGSYDWTALRETITAPAGAVRMALFMGLRPSKGELNFDDIDIKTESAPAPPQAAPREILPPRLPLERCKATFFVDLAPIVNRGLADDVENDGKGGWTDQGPRSDMRAFQVGARSFGGVKFNILPAPRSIVVLKSSMRAPGDLPSKVLIPVGRKADTLFFLHACGWMPSKGEAFRYVVHYKDGRDEVLPVTAQNLADWWADPVERFPEEQKTFSTVAETLPREPQPRGSVYRMEWNSPLDRRAVEIESIEFIGGGKCVPILLGLTGVIEW
jgi:hypothetical protein